MALTDAKIHTENATDVPGMFPLPAYTVKEMVMSEEIDRYQAAYKLANGKTRYDISYERGWFVFREPPWGITFRRVRRAELDEMTARLELRSKL